MQDAEHVALLLKLATPEVTGSLIQPAHRSQWKPGRPGKQPGLGGEPSSGVDDAELACDPRVHARPRLNLGHEPVDQLVEIAFKVLQLQKVADPIPPEHAIVLLQYAFGLQDQRGALNPGALRSFGELIENALRLVGDGDRDEPSAVLLVPRAPGLGRKLSSSRVTRT